MHLMSFMNGMRKKEKKRDEQIDREKKELCYTCCRVSQCPPWYLSTTNMAGQKTMTRARQAACTSSSTATRDREVALLHRCAWVPWELIMAVHPGG